jgi:hypothetical protein
VELAETTTVNLVMELGQISEELAVVTDLPLANTTSSELSYLVSEETISELPLNGRNYTDLALLQPGVVAFRNRDNFGSIVAHGLATSVNGRDPRSNVYLLDGTPQNDFTNGPAGSAASTALGVDTIQEFRVVSNAYSAEYGRNYGGQINVVTKSGTNDTHGSLYYFHRNDNLDARNFFDRGESQPEFKRHQFGGTVGGTLQKDRWFYFVGYEGLREDLGRSLTTVVPDLPARQGFLPDPDNPDELINVGVDPEVAPYLNEYPLPNDRNLGGGLAIHNFQFDQVLDQNFFQGRIDHQSDSGQMFLRYTFDDAEVGLPTDYPQFPRAFISRNQFVTGEYRRVFSPMTIGTFRLNFGRTRIEQDVAANTSSDLAPFVPTRALMGNIDVGGMPRFGPQISVDVSLVQNVYGLETGFDINRGAHLIKVGGIIERYQDNMVNPTFSLGVYNFPSLERFLTNRPLRYLGLGPEGELDRYWRFNLGGIYIQDDWNISQHVTLNLGLRYEVASVPKEIRGRDVTLLDLNDPEPTVGQLYKNPTWGNIAPRFGFAWDVLGDGTTALRGGYGLFYNTNIQQNLIVTVTNPPFTPRFVIPSPSFPHPSFESGIGNSLRPIEWNLKSPGVHVWNLNLQRELGFDTLLTVGYAASRGNHLLRNADVNIPEPERLEDGTLFWPVDSGRPNSNFSTIEQKTSGGDSWYHALILEVRKRFGRGVSFQSSYTFSRSIDNTQASTFFSDARNGTTSAFPEFGTNYNKGLSDFHAKHNWVVNFIWQLPFGADSDGAMRLLLEGWQVAGIVNVQSGNPLTTFVRANRSRSRWSPSILPGLGFDRPSLASGFTHGSAVTGDPDQYFNPDAFELQPTGTLGNLGRGTFDGPNLRAVNLQAMKRFPFDLRARESEIQFRFEIFNLLNRANFSTPSLLAFSGVRDTEQTLPTFGRIRSTSTSARQIQLGLKFLF